MSVISDSPTRLVSLSEVEQFFYIARQRGYVDPKAHRYLSPGRPGFRYTVYAEGSFRMMDEWCSNPSDFWSSGYTTIWFDQIPVWQMFYWGMYTEEAAKFLKEALRASYQDDKFYGGRGRVSYEGVDSQGDKLVYRNIPKYSSFGLFEGSEDITLVKKQRQLGYHNYMGFSLMPN